MSSKALSRVVGDLFIGNLAAASDAQLLRHEKIVTVLSFGFDLELKPPFRYKAYPELMDDPAELIVHLFPECIEFIAQGLKHGPTLVHCYAGMSRSASVVIAYLMHSQQISADAARQQLEARHPITKYVRCATWLCLFSRGVHYRPNDGFWKQLQLFEHMNYQLDMDNHAYKRLVIMQKRQHNERLDSTFFAADPVSATPQRGSLRCKMCRRQLVLPESIIVHEPGEGIVPLSGTPHGQANAKVACTSLFVEPMAWMKLEDSLSTVQGKVKCPKCDAKLGLFNWAGMQCSCGSWQSPAFSMHKKSVDVVAVAPDSL